MLIITTVIAIIALIIASITDIKTREVPDWLNYSLIIIGVGIHGIYSLVFNNSNYIISSLMGLLAFFIIAWIMFKTGQWGGGDSKMLMAIGALVGLNLSVNDFLLGFFINALLVGSVYGIIWGIILLIKNKKRFKNKLNIILKKKKIKLVKKIVYLSSTLPFLFLLINYSMPTLVLAIALSSIIYIFFITIIFSKAIEDSFMYKFVSPSKLTEGDWIANNIKIKGKLICGPKDLGISAKQIKKLIQLKVKEVKIKEGIPFIPPFLISFVLTLFVGNLFLLVV